MRAKGEAQGKIVISRPPASAIAREAESYHVVVVGATREALFQQLMFGSIPEAVARNTDKPVVMVKKYEGAVASFLKRMANLIGVKVGRNKVH